MNCLNRLALLLFVLQGSLATLVLASVQDYKYPKNMFPSYSNYGTIGIIQMPNARMMPAGSLGFSWSDMDPYKRGSIVAYPFSWFEASYQYTDIGNALYSNIEAFSGKQTYKDKSFDAKFLIFKESRYIPAIAAGARDIAGTGVFSSEFIVASKKINNFDISLGMGWGVMANNSYFSNPFSYLADRFKTRGVNEGLGGNINTDAFFAGDAGIFGGVEISIPNFNGLRVKVEYDGIDYTKEGFPFGEDSFKYAFRSVTPQESKINYGLVYPLNNNFNFKFSYVKGNTLSFGFSLKANLGAKNPVIPKKDPYVPTKNADVVRDVTARKESLVYLSSLRSLRSNSLFLQNAEIKKNKLDIVFTQSKHSSFARAAGRAFSVLDEVSPEYIDTFKISNINGGVGMHSIEIKRDAFKRNKESNLYKLATKDTKVTRYKYNPENYTYSPRPTLPAFFYKLVPTIRSQIGGPDGFYFGDLRFSAHTETIFKKNLTLVTSASIGVIDNYDNLKLASDSSLPHVRTDIVKYLKESKDYSVRRMQLNYFLNPYKDFYAKLSGGLLEEMFGGVGGEVLYRPFNKTWGIGAEIWRVKQRGYDEMFSFDPDTPYETTTGHINIYLKEPKSQVLLTMRGGKFLAQDSGIYFDFSRRFKSGLRMGAFFSTTDISEAEFGEGSFDKGFYFYIPVDIFFNFHSKGNAAFGLRPITRDGAAILVHSHHLWGITEQAQGHSILRDWDDIYD
jgi:hypothetical protein